MNCGRKKRKNKGTWIGNKVGGSQSIRHPSDASRLLVPYRRQATGGEGITYKGREEEGDFSGSYGHVNAMNWREELGTLDISNVSIGSFLFLSRLSIRS